MFAISRRLTTASLALVLTVATPAFAQAPQQATEAQVIEMLEAIDLRKVTDDLMTAMMAQSQQIVQQSLPGKVSAQDREIISELMQEHQKIVQTALTWDRLSPIYVRVYQQTLTADEVRALTAFYRTAEGRSAMAKMPQMMQLTMQEMQPILQDIMKQFERSLEKLTDAE